MTSTNQDSYVYAGLAGETAPGRQVNSGLYRMSNNDGHMGAFAGQGQGRCLADTHTSARYQGNSVSQTQFLRISLYARGRSFS